MKYFAITQPTATWLLARTEVLNALHQIVSQKGLLESLQGAEVSEGSFRLAVSSDGKITTAWHIDYLSGTGEELWGFIKREPPLGLLEHPDISREVFERCLYIINQRLQGMMLDTSLIHRSWPNGAHTCTAGRGHAQQVNLGYLESDIEAGGSRQHTLVIVGPTYDFGVLASAAAEEQKLLSSLLQAANDSISPHRRRPVVDSPDFIQLRSALSSLSSVTTLGRLADVTVKTHGSAPPEQDFYRTIGWTYEQWISPDSPLSPVQRRIFESDAILEHPIRIVGPAGSGKTLLMQLLAMRRLIDARNGNTEVRVLYVVHNAAMARNVTERFVVLGGDEFLTSAAQVLEVTTLAQFGKTQLGMHDSSVIDPDAHEAKLFQLEQVSEALKIAFIDHKKEVEQSSLLSQAANDQNFFGLFSRLVMAEISTAIKGHGLTHDEKKYVNAERRLSRLHGSLTQDERIVIYKAFLHYNRAVFEEMEVLDSDDIALSLLGRLRTPIWEMKRKKRGYDFIFVDETQLFNENERRLFALLTRDNKGHVPIALALDEAQEVYGMSSAGLGALGIEAITNESLPSSHRSTKAIMELAFFVIQRTTDLFGPDFPDFTRASLLEENERNSPTTPPLVAYCSDTRSFGASVVKRIRHMRRQNLRQIAVVCHSDIYWDELHQEFKKTDLPLHVLIQRGDPLNPDQPVVALTRPAYVGGQEFDAVISVGLEQGIVPPKVHDSALAAAIEQQVLREIYIAFTRARYQLHVLLNAGTSPTSVIQEAINSGLLQLEQNT